MILCSSGKVVNISPPCLSGGGASLGCKHRSDPARNMQATQRATVSTLYHPRFAVYLCIVSRWQSSCARAADAASTSMFADTGTLSTEPYVAIAALTSSAVTHCTWRTKCARSRPGRTNACVTSRISPFATIRLQPLHIALPVGAREIENVCGFVLKWQDFMSIRKPNMRAGMRHLSLPNPSP